MMQHNALLVDFFLVSSNLIDCCPFLFFILQNWLYGNIEMDVKKPQPFHCGRAVKVSHVKYTFKQNDNDENSIQKACFYSHLWLE